jgi:hypothetical protein
VELQTRVREADAWSGGHSSEKRRWPRKGPGPGTIATITGLPQASRPPKIGAWWRTCHTGDRDGTCLFCSEHDWSEGAATR